MKTIWREKASEAVEISSEEEILTVNGWWRPKGMLEVFPAGFIPIFLAFETSNTDIEDDELIIVPKSRQDAKYASKNAYICCKIEKKEEIVKRYKNAKLGWAKVSWNGLV